MIRSREGVAAVLGRTAVATRSEAVVGMSWTPSARRRCFGGAGGLYGCAGAVRGCDEAARALRVVYGKERRCDGCGGGGRGPGTPVDAAADLDGIWRLDALPAGP